MNVQVGIEPRKNS